jgi:hypothetical protein
MLADVSRNSTFKTIKAIHVGESQLEKYIPRGLENESSFGDFDGRVVINRPEVFAKDGVVLWIIWQSSKRKWKMELGVKMRTKKLEVWINLAKLEELKWILCFVMQIMLGALGSDV